MRVMMCRNVVHSYIHTVPPSTLLPESSTADEICDEIGLPPYVLDTEFPDHYSVNLSFAKLIPDWKVFAQGLGLSPQDIRGIETNISLTIMMQSTETINIWKSRFGFKARYRMLVDVALQHRLLNLARQFCRLLQSKSNVPYWLYCFMCNIHLYTVYFCTVLTQHSCIRTCAMCRLIVLYLAHYLRIYHFVSDFLLAKIYCPQQT